ncbi:MAG TPA: restriction endonuclease subunit R, partial [Candidatus Hydrogenedentes bacterium]|nr:restriction endonuclease subunit R [Candidatus Hydrogenedentota bacterium]
PADAAARLERLEGDGRPLYSLANALCLRRPVVIVDEAHNANTPLSYDTLAKVYPSCIIEFTATPKAASNVLHSVSASELDAEEMIKMPIRLETRPQWRELLADAVRMRDRLEEQARREREEHGGEYLRPVMLIQAQKKNEKVTVEVIKNCLLEDHRIPEAQIAVATGAEDTLAGQDVMSPDCPVRHIITVDKLREGWDCPFAYVLATVREMQSSTAIQQILGRVMRLPHARKRHTDALNRAYAFSVSDTIGAALGSLRDTLVQIGFEKFDARNMVVPAPGGGGGGLFDYAGVEECPAVSVPVPAPLAADALSEEGRAAVAYDEATESLLVSAPISDAVARELKAAYPTAEGQAAVARAVAASHRLARRQSPAEVGTPFEVPLLCCRQDDFLDVFDEAHFMDRAWELRSCDAALSDAEYPKERSAAQIGEIVQEEGRLQTRFLQHLHDQMAGLADPRGWTAEGLAVWLDRSIPHHDLPPSETGPFLVKALGHLMTERGIVLADLVYEKYRLKDALEKKIEGHRQAARKQAFQELISGTSLTVIPDDPLNVFAYAQEAFSYGSSTPYTGHRRFNKHFYPKVYDLKAEGEEYECACFLDSMDEVAYWVRNIERRPEASFWLQTSTDKFYPDFVCKLRDGRVLVVEYKGEDRWSNDDSREKRLIGGLWEERSGGACLFIMPRGKDFAAIKAKVRGAGIP